MKDAVEAVDKLLVDPSRRSNFRFSPMEDSSAERLAQPIRPAYDNPTVSDVTRLFDAIERGEPKAAEELLPLLYAELRRLAAHMMADERPGQTLQPTALVHEAWLRLLGPGGEPRFWNTRGHFFSAAAEAMRRILIDRARRHRSEKHGGGLERIDLEQVELAIATDDESLLALDAALEELCAEDPQCAELVKLRFFAGLTMPEAAKALGLSERSAHRAWAYARAWLHDRIQGSR